MVCCAAYGCYNRSDKRQNTSEKVTFHKFPRDVERRNKWIKAVNRKDWVPNHTSVLCSIHFTKDCFDLSYMTIIKLHNHAVPTIFHFPSSLRKYSKRNFKTCLRKEIIEEPEKDEEYIEEPKEEKYLAEPKEEEYLEEHQTEFINLDEDTFKFKEEVMESEDITLEKLNTLHEKSAIEEDPLASEENTNMDGDSTGEYLSKEICDTNKEGKQMSLNLKCNLCDYLAKTTDELSHHKCDAHVEKITNICKYCDYKNIDWDELNEHIKTKHTSKGYKCGTCDMVFPKRLSLSRHIISHAVRPKMDCIICNSSFSNAGGYKLHLNGTHNGIKPFACIHCKKTFEMAEDSKFHRIEHVHKSICETCEKSFTSYDKLLTHFVEIHKGEIIKEKDFVPTEKYMNSQSENLLFISYEAVLERQFVPDNSENLAKNPSIRVPKTLDEKVISIIKVKNSKILVKQKSVAPWKVVSSDLGITKHKINLWKNTLAQSLQESDLLADVSNTSDD